MPTASEIQSLERAARKVARGSDECKSMVERIVEMEDDAVLRELAKSGASTQGSEKEARNRLLRLQLRLQGYESATWTPEVDGDVTFYVVPRDSEQLSDLAGAGAAMTSTNTVTGSTVITSSANSLTSSGATANNYALNLRPAPIMSAWINAEPDEPTRLALQARGWTPPPTPIDSSRRQRKSLPKESAIAEEMEGESSRRSSTSRSTSRASTPVRGSGRSKLAAQIQQLSEQLAILSAGSLDEQRADDEKSRKKSSLRADSRERKQEKACRKPRDSSSEKEKRVAGKPESKAKRRTKPPRESSASSSEASEAETRANRTRAGRKMDGLTRREKFMRLLASYKLNFKSGDKTKAQLFLERAKEFRDSVPMTLTEFFDVMSFAFSSADSSDLWYRTHKRRFVTFADFETAFKNMYIGPCDEDDIIDDLQHKVQGKNESISEYLTFVRHLVMQLDDPPTEKKLARMVWRNLRPAYRLVLNDECPSSIDTIENRGLKYERGRAFDAKIEKSGKDRAAYAETKSAKVGALAVESTNTNASSGNVSGKKNSNGGKKSANDKPNANANANANASSSAKTSANADAPAAQQTTSSQPTGAAGGFIGACYGCGETGHRASRCPHTKCYRCHGFGHRARECSMPPPAASPSTEKCQFCGMENAIFLTCPRCVALRQALGNFHAEAQRSQAPPQAQNQQR
uniref:CCHC-type domain-containing protein n=1 Tax=Trichogramma kaykai TaxID=54128 RepID=A0ABD2XHD8_9HYME